MVQTIDVDKIRTGWTAFDVRGEKIGDVAEIGSNYAPRQEGPVPSDRPVHPAVSRGLAGRSAVDLRSERAKGEGRGDGLAEPAGRWQLGRLDATESLDIPLREERSDAVRGYVDADEAQTMNVFQIQPGWTAYDVMAEKLGVASRSAAPMSLSRRVRSFRPTSTSRCLT